MSSILRRILTFTAAAAAVGGMDPRLFDLLPPDSAVIVGFDVERTKESPTGKIYAEAVARSGSPFLAGPAGYDLSDFAEFTMAIGKGGAAEGGVLLVGRGAFSLEKLAGRRKLEQYKGLPLVSPSRQGMSTVLALLGDIAVESDQRAPVIAAVDRHRANAVVDPALADRLQQAARRHDFWVFSVGPPAAAMAPGEGADPKMPFVQAVGTEPIRQLRNGLIGIKFGERIAIAIEAESSSASNARAAADTIELLLRAMAAHPATASPILESVSNSLRTAVEGASLTIACSVPRDQFEKSILGALAQ